MKKIFIYSVLSLSLAACGGGSNVKDSKEESIAVPVEKLKAVNYYASNSLINSKETLNEGIKEVLPQIKSFDAIENKYIRYYLKDSAQSRGSRRGNDVSGVIADMMFTGVNQSSHHKTNAVEMFDSVLSKNTKSVGKYDGKFNALITKYEGNFWYRGIVGYSFNIIDNPTTDDFVNDITRPFLQDDLYEMQLKTTLKFIDASENKYAPVYPLMDKLHTVKKLRAYNKAVAKYFDSYADKILAEKNKPEIGKFYKRFDFAVNEEGPKADRPEWRAWKVQTKKTLTKLKKFLTFS